MKRTVFAFLSGICSLGAIAQNPIVTHCYTADPAPMVCTANDSLYVYCDEDMNVPGVNDFYYMERWRVYSTVDMVNWTDHGEAMPRTAFTWAREGTCWASQCVERGGYYYWYMCVSKPNDWMHYIGVGRSEKPSGPFRDVMKAPIVTTNSGGDIDPTVFVDDDKQAYLYWGNNKLCYVKLKNNMMTYNTNIGNKGIVSVPLTKEAFGGVKVEKDGKTVIDGTDCYEEGPWLDKRGDKYYLMYAAGGVPEHISYSMSDSPEGPWKYVGQVMKQQDTGSFTNHSGIVNYKGTDYFFYHTGWAPGGGGYNRSMAVQKFTFKSDGKMPSITATKKGVSALCNMNPFICQQAETINAAYGIKVTGNESKGVYVTDIHSGDTIHVKNLDFSTGTPKSLTVRVASTGGNGKLICRQGTSKGNILATVEVKATGGLKNWEEVTVDLSRVPSKVKDICFTFSGTTASNETTLMNFDWWKFNTEEETSIESLSVSTVNDNCFYDLTGRKAVNPRNGIYIRNGRKTVIR